MKFDFVIGNPPYQDETLGDNKGYAPPVYHKFLEESYKVGNAVEMIHPARFLFNAGSTPKAWNEQMLNDPHIKVKLYQQDSSKVFSNTDIKGGVAVTYRDGKKKCGAIGTFTPYNEMNSIVRKVCINTSFDSIASIIFIQNRFDLQALYEDYPESRASIGSDGRDSRLEKNIFIKVPIFQDSAFSEDIKVLGVLKNKRTWKHLKKKYIDMSHENLSKYKVVLPVANGSGDFGQMLSSPIVQTPFEAYTRSFIGIGAFETIEEAEAALKYVKTKFARAMLSVLKVTQMNNKDVWEKVPIQDFTPDSDIDWSGSVAEIDQQLYRKYGLSDDEITFIETKVKEMI